ncbi:MAG: polysaccharide biosynthesis protein [Dongiaceae bacterium]
MLSFWLRAPFILLLDTLAAAIGLGLALYLRLGDLLFTYPVHFFEIVFVTFLPITVVVFLASGLYQRLWRYTGREDAIAIISAVTAILLLFTLALFLVNRLQDFPRSSLIISWFVITALLGGARLSYRLWREGHIGKWWKNETARIPVLLIGTGGSAEAFVRATKNPDNPYAIIGILSDDPSHHRRRLYDIPVLGKVAELGTLWHKLKAQGLAPQRALLADEYGKGQDIQELFHLTDMLGLALARLPRLTDFRAASPENIQQLRPISLADLLGRAPNLLPKQGVDRLLHNKTVLITGAGGSIGGELSRQVAATNPKRLLLLDSSEHALYLIDRDLRLYHPMLDIVPCLLDVRDQLRLGQLFNAEKPDLVFHAAALKHVPLMEDNPLEAILTNVQGTQQVADLCKAHGVSQMIMVSTDKAVNPTNIMGATKRLAELYCQMRDREGGATRFTTVRFGNVLGSNGSVVPLFQAQIERGGPVTVTDPNVTRYFMSIEEAVALILQAAAMPDQETVPRGSIFVLEMGQPIKIADLAKLMIRLAGAPDMTITFTGLRPGEKLHEELFYAFEESVPTTVPGVEAALALAPESGRFMQALEQLVKAAEAGQKEASLAIVSSLVLSYKPSNKAA